MSKYTQENRVLRISDDLFGKDVLLLKEFRGVERLGRPFRYELTLFSETPNLPSEAILGKRVTVSLETGRRDENYNSITRYFNGFVSRFSQKSHEGPLYEYHATMVPWIWFLTLSSDCRIFQSLTVPQILGEVFNHFGYSGAVRNTIPATSPYRTRDYCVQYRETAFQFVSRLMEEEGIYYYFDHSDGQHLLVLCDSPAAHDTFAGYETLRYDPNPEHDDQTLLSWQVRHELQPDAYTTCNFNFTDPANPLIATAGSGSSSPTGLFDYLGEQGPEDKYPSLSSPQRDYERYSQTRLEELRARYETYEGTANVRGLEAGRWFTLRGGTVSSADAAYLVTGADYEIVAAPFRSEGDPVEMELTFATTVAAIPRAVPFRAPRLTPKPVVDGPQTAIVVGPNGEKDPGSGGTKINTDEYGRVRVRFHWDRRTGANAGSCWMRVSQGWAGKGWGDMAIPHVGHEVIVDFLEGDPDRPIVTGRVYNGTNRPAYNPADYTRLRVLRDDSGNQIILDSDPSGQSVVLQEHSGMRFNLTRRQ